MARHFNKLSPAQAERLAYLLEELGEAQQAVGKILRHGYDSWNPVNAPQMSNRTALERELADVHVAILFLCKAGDLDAHALSIYSRVKEGKIEQWMHHQPKKEEEEALGDKRKARRVRLLRKRKA